MEEEGKFNFGVDTLRRISNTLERIKLIRELPANITRQRLHIDAVQSFFQDAAVLMSLKTEHSQDLIKYQKEIDGLRLSSRMIRGRQKIFYNSQLETRLNQIVREVSIVLNTYFMPKKEYDDDDY